MDHTRTARSMADLSSIQHGWDVYAADGEKVGDVSEIRGDHLIVSKGWLFPTERYVPASAVARVEHDRVYLNVAKADIDAQDWDRMPDEVDTYHEGRTARPAAMGVAERADTGDRTIELREEELRARKEMHEVGEVEVRKEVHTEQRTIDVPVTREEVVVERHPVDRREATGHEIGEETIRVPVREEEVTVEKRPVVTEEITVGKRPVTETQRVTETVRREEVGIEHDDEARVSHSGAGIRHWDEIKGDFRNDWQTRHGAGGRTWEQDEPGYRHGWESAHDERYRGREWPDVESDLSTDWGSRYGRHGAWDQARGNARQAWDRARSRV